MSWGFPDASTIEVEFTVAGSAFAGMGFGIGMNQTDMVIGWVHDNGTVEAYDYWATGHHMPSLDTDLQGGVDNVKVVGGQRVGNRTTVRYQRPLDTGDKWDKVLSSKPGLATDIIYAGKDGTPGAIGYHGDRHNHVQVDLSRADGTPQSAFGAEETGLTARQLVRDGSVGTLVTLQNEVMVGREGMAGYPYGSVASFADTQPSTGMPILLLSTLERNIINIQDDPRCSLAVHTPGMAPWNNTDPMMEPRTTIMGNLVPVPAAGIPAARKAYLAKHPVAAMWIDFDDFALYSFNVSDTYWVGGFGTTHYIGWVGPDQYLSHKL